MNNKQQQLLNEMKKLIRSGNRKFAERKDRDIVSDLAELGLTFEDAWNIILGLNSNFYYIDPKPYYNQNNKRKIKDKDVYIKLVLEKTIDQKFVVCLSFHRDYKKVLE